MFAALPTAYLVMTPDLVMVDANKAYEVLSGRTRDEIVGRYVFDVFPPTPGALDERGENPLQLSFERARDTGDVDQMPLFAYDIEDPATGQMVPRVWSLISAPVFDEHGRTRLLLQRVEDVTSYVDERDSLDAEREQGTVWQRRFEVVEADLFVRAQELRAALQAQGIATRRLSGLAEAALQLAAAETLADLTETVVRAALVAFGADGGAIAVRDEDAGVLRLTITESLGEQTRRQFAELPLDSSLPAAESARSGSTVLLPDRAAGIAWSPDMARVYEATGRQRWASVPMQVGDRVIGALVASWTEPHEFDADEVDLLAAFAAQYAQALDRLQVRAAEQRAAAVSRQLSETLQRSLLTDPPEPEDLQIAVRYRPASAEAQIGGDWYDAFLTESGDTTLVVGDVTGHDRNAAATMGQVRNVLRGVAQNVSASPARVLSALDRTLRHLEVDTLATAVLAQVHRNGHDQWSLGWSNAGHPPPLLLLPDGTAVLLQREPDLLLGLVPQTPRGDHEVELPAGATVLLFTDGLIERRGELLDDGLERLRSTAAALHGLDVEALCDALLEPLGDDAQDDIALLALRVSSARTQVGRQAPAELAYAESAELVLAPDPGAVREARQVVRQTCHAAGVDSDTCDSAVLLTSETVTNAFVHGRSEARLSVHANAGTVLVEVGDDNSRHPALVTQDAEALDGRGIALLEALATAWGVREEPYGKVVWFEVGPG